MWSEANEKIPQDIMKKIHEIFDDCVVVGESEADEPEQTIKVVYYSLRKANEAGERRHPQIVLKEFGYKIIEWVGQPIFDRVDVRVHNFIENPPDFICQKEMILSETDFVGSTEGQPCNG